MEMKPKSIMRPKYLVRGEGIDSVVGVMYDPAREGVLILGQFGQKESALDIITCLLPKKQVVHVKYTREGWRVRWVLPLSAAGWRRGLTKLRKRFELEEVRSFRRLGG